jgi:hypothetical protein
MIIIAIIGVGLAVGAFLLLRSPPPSEQPAAMSAADVAVLRDSVRKRLEERLVGFDFDAPPDKPYELVASEAGSERRIYMNLEQLGQSWYPLYSKRLIAEADDLIESFVAGASGQAEGTDEVVDDSGARDMLALRLVRPEGLPPDLLTRKAGDLVAVLVLRDPGGVVPIRAAELESMSLKADEAFQLAFDNLKRDVEEGLEVEPLDEARQPNAIAVAPKDPLATSYVLVPALAARLRKVLGDRRILLYLDSDSLVAAAEGVEVEREKPLIEGAPGAEQLAWESLPLS